MSEKNKVARFNRSLDSLLKDNFRSCVDDEFTPELKLAQKLKQLDLSDESKIKDFLRKKLLTAANRKYSPPSYSELSDEDLQQAAGGEASSHVMLTCSICSRLFRLDSSAEGKCPHCSS